MARPTARNHGDVPRQEGGQEAPSFVSLGADGTYFMRTVCGGGSWDLKITPKSQSDGMKGTNSFLEEAANFKGVAVSFCCFVFHDWYIHRMLTLDKGLYLFPHHPQSYVLLLTSGKAFSNLPEHTWATVERGHAAMGRRQSIPRPSSPGVQAGLESRPIIPPQIGTDVGRSITLRPVGRRSRPMLQIAHRTGG